MAKTIQISEEKLAELQALYTELSEFEAAYKANKLAFFRPIGAQPEFFSRGDHFVRMAVGSNRSGKSVCGVAEASAHAIGERIWLPKDHPDRIVRMPNGNAIPVPNVGRVVAENFPIAIEQTIWPKFEEWLPKGMIKRVKRNQRGYVERIDLVNGSVIHLMAYSQDDEVFEGTNGHWAWMDEPPPRSKFVALARGLVDFGGHCWMTMTPIMRPWTHEEIYSRAGDGDNYAHVTHLSIWDNCIDNGGYLSREAIETFIKTLSPEERRARVDGEYLHLTGLVFNEWKAKPPYWIDPFAIPASWPRVCVIDPHPRKPVAVCWLAFAPSGVRYVYRTLFDEKLVTVGDVARRIKDLERWGTGHQEPIALRIIDDSSRQQERTSGETVHARFAREGIPCRLAYKRNYWAGIDAIHQDLKVDAEWHEPGLQVFNTCGELKSNFLKFAYDEWNTSGAEEQKGPKQDVRKIHDDFIDCVRYTYQLKLNYNMLYGMNRELAELSRPSYRREIAMPGADPGGVGTKWQTPKQSGFGLSSTLKRIR